ncbi:transposase [Vibrio crassostreae]|uniref:hypothetical protein n=1 Tax=Vibrio TaxID=662 RepID=UPI001FEE7306|nr:hypothetical protein [Vibrio crassostreae]CAK1799048.1 transposase [Vibrio crassostreae]CAK1812188.1 transposase [Vibrio crassostreae]CAK1815788.1 transposase [Vibrio crassostreae]CAK2287483.1 transposase [Vibrio crassostreae]CAK2287776.1 transposase [Vibrio crassostreae]
MKKRTDTQKAFREIYSVERAMEGASRFLGYYEVFSKYQVKDSRQVHMVASVRCCLHDRDSGFYDLGTLASRLRFFKRTGRLSCFKNY